METVNDTDEPTLSQRLLWDAETFEATADPLIHSALIKDLRNAVIAISDATEHVSAVDEENFNLKNKMAEVEKQTEAFSLLLCDKIDEITNLEATIDALRSALELWDAFIVEVNKDAGVDCKNFLGSVNKYKEIFLNAARAA